MKIYYRDILLYILLVVIMLYYYITLLLFSMSIFTTIIYYIISYVIVCYYILITPMFYYFSRFTIEMFIRDRLSSKIEFMYDSILQEYDIRILGKRYYFHLDKLYSSYIYEIYHSDYFCEEVQTVYNILKECDIKYGLDSHISYERSYYIESYMSIILLGILFLLFFLYNIFFIG